MTNGGINVEIGNPSYNMYEVDHDNHADAGSLLRPNFTLDPHKVGVCVCVCVTCAQQHVIPVLIGWNSVFDFELKPNCCQVKRVE